MTHSQLWPRSLMPYELTACSSASPCAGYASVLYVVVVSCSRSMHPAADVPGGGIFRALLAVPFVCRPSTLSCQRLRLKVKEYAVQCLTVLVTHPIFHQCWRHLNRGIAFRNLSANHEKWAFLLWWLYGTSAL